MLMVGCGIKKANSNSVSDTNYTERFKLTGEAFTVDNSDIKVVIDTQTKILYLCPEYPRGGITPLLNSAGNPCKGKL